MRFPEILSIRPEPVVSSYSAKDTILYALGVGMGADPAELPFVYEKALRVLPSMSAVQGRGFEKILVEGGIDFTMLLHGEQRLRIHKLLPPAGRIVTSARCLSVIDKGAGKGALLNVECTIADAAKGDLYSTLITTLFCRGDGGFDGPTDGALMPHEVPASPHDREVLLKTRPDQAILYRLTGDRNPLHIDPAFAAQAGFEKPVLHGLCTYGFACRALLQAYCDLDPTRMKSLDVRFSSPVFPGETIVTRMWKRGPTVSFECAVAERPVTVIRNGRCELVE